MRIILTVLALVSFAACSRDQGGEVAKPDTILYSYLPSDATFIAGARLAAMRNSPVYTQFRDRLPREVRPYESEATEIVIAGSGGDESLILARGKFDKQRIERDSKNTPPGGELAFLANDLIAIGRPAGIESARGRAGSALTAKIPAAAHIWAVTNGGLPIDLPERSNLSNLSRLSQDLKLGVLGIQVTDAVRADLLTEFQAPKSAEQMQTALRGFIGLARLSTPDDQPHYLQALDAIQIQRSESQVTLTADWPPTLVDTVLKALPTR
jgi:hypothetical protein